MSQIEGVFRLQYFHDVGEAIDLDRLRTLLKIDRPARGPEFRQRAPDYVRFERPPVEIHVADDSMPARLRYFEYGVVCVEMEVPFACDWPALVELASKWIGADAPQEAAERIVARQLERIGAAIHKPATQRLTEDYTVIELHKASEASALLAVHGAEIAQAVRGERLPLSESERAEVLASSMSYSTGDLLVVGYAAALVYDQQPDGAAPMRQLLEYANTQLLEFRHYDEVLTRVLAEAQASFAKRPGFLRHWRSGKEAHKLNALRLEIIDLTERTDNAIKFLSDMFYARTYKLASARIGVPDYRALVESKLLTAGELYRFRMDEYHQGRAFLLELTVVIILIIELAALFTGKR